MGIREKELNRGRVLAVVGGASAGMVLLVALVATLTIASGGADLWRAPFRIMCHGQLDRAFEIAGTAMPICARCTGIYAGIILGSIWMFTLPIRRRSSLAFVTGLAIAAPMVVDGLMQTLRVWSTGNFPRSLTGILFGIGLTMLAANGLAQDSEELSEGDHDHLLSTADIVER